MWEHLNGGGLPTEVIRPLENIYLGPEFSSVHTQPPDGSAITQDPVAAAGDLKAATRDFQRTLIRRALLEHEGNWAAAARSLGMHRSNFHHLAARLGLKEPS